MGVLSNTSTVLSIFKADTKQHRAELKKLKGAEKDRHKSMVEGLEGQNTKLDAQIGRLGKLAKAVGVVAVSYAALKNGFEAYGERQQMIAAGAGKATESLRKSSMGLISTTKLMNVEAALLNGTQSLNNEEMNKAVKLMMALRKEGNDFNEVQTEVTKAFVELNGEGLKKFGVNLKGAAGSVEMLNSLLLESDKHVLSFGGNLTVKGDDAKRALVNMKDATDNLKLALGRLAEKIIPLLDGPLNWMIDKMNMAAEGWGKLYNLFVQGGRPQGKDVASTITRETQKLQTKAGREMVPLYSGGPLGGLKKQDAMLASLKVNELIEQAANKMMVGDNPLPKFREQLMSLADKDGGLTRDQASSIFSGMANVWNNQVQPIRAEMMAGKAAGKAAQKLQAEIKAQKKKIEEEQKRLAKVGGASGKRGSILDAYDDSLLVTDDDERVRDLIKLATSPIGGIPKALGAYPTGPAGEFSYGGPSTGPRSFLGINEGDVDAVLGAGLGTIDKSTIAVNSLSTAWDGFGQAFGGAIGAFIDGTEPFGKAIKRMTGEVLKSIAVQSSIEALKHSAYAVARFAFLDYAGAAQHAKAAAMHGGVALAAGIGARQFGVGAAAPATVAAGGGGGQTTRNQTIILGADFAEDSARSRSHRLADILRHADRTGAGGSVVEYS